MLRAMRRERRSSPYWKMTSASSSSTSRSMSSSAVSPLSRVHAHVDRALAAEAHPALGVVELRRAHAQVGARARRRAAMPERGRARSRTREKSARTSVTRSATGASRSSRGRDGRRVAIEARRCAPSGSASSERHGVAPAAERRVDVDAARRAARARGRPRPASRSCARSASRRSPRRSRRARPTRSTSPPRAGRGARAAGCS